MRKIGITLFALVLGIAFLAPHAFAVQNAASPQGKALGQAGPAGAGNETNETNGTVEATVKAVPVRNRSVTAVQVLNRLQECREAEEKWACARNAAAVHELQDICSELTGVAKAECFACKGETPCLKRVRACLAANDSENCTLQLREFNARENRCKHFADEDRKLACLRQEFGVGDVASKKKWCEAQENTSQCIGELKHKVLGFINYQFQRYYNWLDRLEEYEAVNQSLVDEMRSFVEEKQAEFENASSNQERRQIIWEVNAEWMAFKRAMLKQIVLNKLDAANVRAENAVQVLNRTRERLHEKGVNATGLDNAISRIHARIQAQEGAGIQAQLMNLKNVQHELGFVKRLVPRILNHQEAPAYEELGDDEAGESVLGIVEVVGEEPAASPTPVVE